MFGVGHFILERETCVIAVKLCMTFMAIGIGMMTLKILTNLSMVFVKLAVVSGEMDMQPAIVPKNGNQI